jgi:hypothetical protein
MKIKKLEEDGELPLKRSFVVWISNKFGRLLRMRIYRSIEEPSNVD